MTEFAPHYETTEAETFDQEDFLSTCRRLQEERGNGFSANAVALAMGLSRRFVLQTLLELERKGIVQRISARLWRIAGSESSDTTRRTHHRNRLPLITTVAPDTIATIDRIMHDLHLPSYGSVIDMLVAVSSRKFLEDNR